MALQSDIIENKIITDPVIGFSKIIEHNFEMI